MSSYYVADFYYSDMQATVEHVEELLKQLGSIKAVAASLEVSEEDIRRCLKWDYYGWDNIVDKIVEVSVFYKSLPGVPIVYRMELPDYIETYKCKKCPMEKLNEDSCMACPDLRKAYVKKKSGRTAG